MTGKIKCIVFILLIINSLNITAQDKQRTKDRLDYIERYKNIAMCEMIEYKIPASITLAQGILESGDGNSELAIKGNNHFGIKCHSDWTGKTMRYDDDKPKECFRVYDSAEESFRDHSIFLSNNSRYAALFKLEITDYKGWAKGLKKAGYATLPTYANVLINLIEDYELQQYDQLVVKGKYKCDKQVTDDKNKGKTDKPKKEKKKKDKKNKHHEVVATVPVLADCAVVGMTPDHHYIRENFGIKFVFTKEGDQLDSLAKELRVSEKQLVKYNDLGDKKTFAEGEVLYIGPKRRRAAQGYEYHKIQQGETLRQVSRLYAVRLDRLFKMNGLDENSILQIGQEIRLR